MITETRWLYKPAFSPQMVHSGYGFDEFPDEYLMRIARANKYGLDVYAYSCMANKFHPEEEGAEAYYESTYIQPFLEKAGKVQKTRCGEAELLLVTARDFVEQTWALLDARDTRLFRYPDDSPKRKSLMDWLAKIDT